MEKKTGKEISWEEASDGAYRLAGFVEIVYKGAAEQLRWEKRLETEPKGFALDGNGRNCAVCGEGTREDTNWYDKWGIKCLTCQRAIDKKIIPGSIARNRDNRYSPYDLESRFGIKKPTLRKMIKEGIIKARVVPTESGHVHCYIILEKDNKELLPPKKMTESQVYPFEKDGKTWHRVEPWYRFVDPFEHLKGYKIMDYLKFVEKESA